MALHNNHSGPSTTTARQPEPRARKSGGTIALLVLLTVGNALTLIVGVLAWADETAHGADWDDESLQLVVVMTLVSLVAVIALGGAWFTRKWGPRLYVLTAGSSLLLALLIAGGAGFNPLGLVGIAFAVVLWLTAESNW